MFLKKSLLKSVIMMSSFSFLILFILSFLISLAVGLLFYWVLQRISFGFINPCLFSILKCLLLAAPPPHPAFCLLFSSGLLWCSFVISWVECSDLWCLNFLLFSNIGIFPKANISFYLWLYVHHTSSDIYTYNRYQINIYRCIPNHLICNSFKMITSIIISSLTYELFIITHLSLQMCRFFSFSVIYFCFALWSENIYNFEYVVLKSFSVALYLVYVFCEALCEFEKYFVFFNSGFYIHVSVKLICCIVQILYRYQFFICSRQLLWELMLKSPGVVVDFQFLFVILSNLLYKGYGFKICFICLVNSNFYHVVTLFILYYFSWKSIVSYYYDQNSFFKNFHFTLEYSFLPALKMFFWIAQLKSQNNRKRFYSHFSENLEG